MDYEVSGVLFTELETPNIPPENGSENMQHVEPDFDMNIFSR